MRADGLLAMLDRWGRLILPGTLLLFFVLLTLAPLRAPYLSDALPLLPALVVFQFSLATPARPPPRAPRPAGGTPRGAALARGRRVAFGSLPPPRLAARRRPGGAAVGAGRPPLPAADPRHPALRHAGRGEPHQPASAGAATRA